MDREFSRRLGADLGRNVLPMDWREMFALENRIRDWANDNPVASWATVPEEFRRYLLAVERTPNP